jgi:parallel beta-helix repeat protein
LESNIADDNDFAGFFLGSSSGNTLEGNSASGNSDGFHLSDASSGNTLADNTGSVNGFAGFNPTRRTASTSEIPATTL